MTRILSGMCCLCLVLSGCGTARVCNETMTAVTVEIVAMDDLDNNGSAETIVSRNTVTVQPGQCRDVSVVAQGHMNDILTGQTGGLLFEFRISNTPMCGHLLFPDEVLRFTWSSMGGVCEKL